MFVVRDEVGEVGQSGRQSEGEDGCSSFRPISIGFVETENVRRGPVGDRFVQGFFLQSF